jgi:tetratricopeptide (TPR) repeat protein
MKKYFPVLLILTIVLFFVTDHLKVDPPEDHDHQEHNEHDEMDHSDPENIRRMAIFHFNEGNKLLQQKKWKDAAKNYHKALNHNREFEEAYINLSSAYLGAKNFDEAWGTLKSLETINPLYPLLHFNLACYYSLTGKTQDSLSALKKAVELGYKNYQDIPADPDLENLRTDPGFKTWFQSIDRKTGD